jgi:hypothetical protein
MNGKLGKEKRIPTGVPLHLLLVVFLRIKLLPYAGWEDMFVAFVPAAIHNFGECRIIIGAFQIGIFGWLFGSSGFV